MDSKEIRQRDPVARTSWSSMEGIGEQIYELTLQVREIAARMAEQAERTPAPETAGAHVSEVRSNPGNENGAWCEICCATLVCPSCGNHRSEPAAPPSDAVTRALDAFNGNDPMAYGETKRMTAALRTFAEALLEESDKTCKVLYSDERSLVNRVLTKAISNLLPEVTP